MKIPWSKPSIGQAEKRALYKTMNSGWLTMGPRVEEFERKLAYLLGRKHVVMVNNGTSALLAALLCKRRHEVTTTAYTFPATINAMKFAGYHKFNLEDINPRTVLMNTPPTKDKNNICVPVSYAGLPISPEVWHDYHIIEDAAESLGAEVHGKQPEHMATYSFHAAKLLTTVEGGCITTNDDSEAHVLRCIRNNGESLEEKGRYIFKGLNLRPTDINATIGLVQLEKLPQAIWHRNRIATMYREGLESYVDFQEIPSYVKKHPYMMFPIFVDDPEDLAKFLGKQGIDTRLGWKPIAPLPNAEYVSKRVLCLPIFNGMMTLQAEYIIKWVRRWSES